MIVKNNNSLYETIKHFSQKANKLISLSFYTPNWLCRFRANTFSTKEPETLAWIDEFGGAGPFFDIGANVGIYSIYFAATKNGRVYSFEPSVFNLPLLAKNIYLNNLQDKISIISCPLNSLNEISDFNLSTLDEGGALSSFGVSYGHDGKELNKTFSYKTLGLSLDFLVSNKLLPQIPELIKIDVDGIEHLILQGSLETLKNPLCKSLLIEVNDDFVNQADSIRDILESCGFILIEKKRSDIVSSDRFAKTYNQIWVKK